MPSYSIQPQPRKDIYQYLYPVTRNYAKPWVAAIIMMCTIIIPCGLLAITLGYYPVRVEISLQAFEITNHPTYIRREALRVATTNFYKENTNTKKRSLSITEESLNSTQHWQNFYDFNSWNRQRRRIDLERTFDYNQLYHHNKRKERAPSDQFSQSFAIWVMDLVYVAQGGDDHGQNIFTAQRLLDIRGIERKIINHPGFTNFCWRSYQSFNNERLKDINYCMPLNSLTTYFFPSQTPHGLKFDGQGDKLANIPGTLRYILSKRESYWYFDSNINEENGSRLLRAQAIFGIPLHGFNGPYDQFYKQREKFTKFVVTYVDMLSKASTENVRVLYGGPQIFDYEVNSAFFNDIKLAGISLGLIFIVFFILTSFSVYLTVIGLLSIVLSFPIAYFIHRVLAGIPTIGILNGTSLFVLIGIGVDDVFVFINTFRQTIHMKELSRRLSFTVITAGKATLFTSFTTAVAFAANTLSEIPAVRDFGLFTALLVIACWVIDILLMPSALCIWSLYLEEKESRFSNWLMRRIRCCKASASSWLPRLPRDLEAHLSDTSYRDVPTRNECNTELSSGLTNIVEIPDISDGSEMKEIGPYTREDYRKIMEKISENGDVENDEGEGVSSLDSLPELIQRFIYYYIAKRVIQAKKTCIIIFTVILVAAAAVVCTQLRTATRLPAFFGESTNLQTLINIRYNITSDSNLDCFTCSGIFIPPMPVVTTPPPTTVSTTVSPTTTPTPTTFASTTQPLTTTPTVSQQSSNSTIDNTHESTTPSTFASEASTSSSSPSPLKPNVTAPLSETTTFRVSTKTPTTTTTKKPVSTLSSSSEATHQFITTPPLTTAASTAKTVATDDPSINPCKEDCNPIVQPPAMDNTAIINIVFGIKGIDNTNVSSNNGPEKTEGTVIYDPKFTIVDSITDYRNLKPKTKATLFALCRICKKIANTEKLVKQGGAKCFPNTILLLLEGYVKGDCSGLPRPNSFDSNTPDAAIVGISKDRTAIKWLSMVFISKIYMGQSSFISNADYQEWENLIKGIKEDPKMPNSVKSVFQTSSYWQRVFIEVTAVGGAIYGVVLSLTLCIGSVAFFTGNFYLTLISLITITCVAFSVTFTFYIAGWQLGMVEAVSLSIIVGTSVDYCAHLVEGYLIAGRKLPQKMSLKELRVWRTSSSMSHIGTSILSSALTTILATIPLCFTQIQLLAKFGQIVVINTLFSIIYTLTICAALLSFTGPPRFIISFKASSIALLIILVIVGVSFLVLYIIHIAANVTIVGPSGRPLFPGY
ncbi:Protein dispatched-like protein 3 [Trichoplax sp. H2]|nr:Protein dispatched-like protein 3 [Trichoplax sp. H2]|eukprot:RDD44089.1 Protein dispatched-like protein 3 [Trichoplax sp. H2]